MKMVNLRILLLFVGPSALARGVIGIKYLFKYTYSFEKKLKLNHTALDG